MSVLLLDLTRTVSRVGGGPSTGIDRVERAYLDALLHSRRKVHGIVRTAIGYALLDRRGLLGLSARLDGAEPWGRAHLPTWVTPSHSPARRKAEADVRRLAFAVAIRPGLHALLRRLGPGPCLYVNVGHAGFGPRMADALARLPGFRALVMIHDAIPLDHPEWQRQPIPAAFDAMLARVAAVADRVVYPSRSSRAAVEHHLRRHGRVPEGRVVPLGVGVTAPEAPPDCPAPVAARPFFLVLGTIEPRKNHALLLDVWEALGTITPEAEVPILLLVGRRGWLAGEALRRLETLPSRGRTLFEINDLDDAGVAWCLARARALLMPSRAEGFGLPVAEALSVGCPVVCSDLAVYRELFGAAPTYLPSDSRYRWLRQVQALAADPHPRPRRPLPMPTWPDHFNAALSMNC